MRKRIVEEEASTLKMRIMKRIRKMKDDCCLKCSDVTPFLSLFFLSFSLFLFFLFFFKEMLPNVCVIYARKWRSI